MRILFLCSAAAVLFAAASASGSGDLAACRLPDRQARRDVALGFPRIYNRMRSTGAVSATVLFVDFPDAPAERSPAETLALLEPARAWYAEVSYGQLQLAFLPLLATLRMPRNASAYNFRTAGAQKRYLQDAAALAAAAPHRWDFSTSESIIVLATPLARTLPNGPAFCALPGQGFTESEIQFENSVTSGADFDYWGHKWLNHEMSHTMALVDLYDYGPGGAVAPNGAAGGGEFGFTGEWSIMGNIAGRGNGLFGYERWLLGWMPDARVLCLDAAGSSRVALAPLQDAAFGDAPRLVIVKAGAALAVCVEFRAAAGLDANITQPGVLVYVVDTAAQSGRGPIRVLPLNSTDASMLSSTLSRAGDAREFAGVRVELLVAARSSAAPVVNITSAGAAPAGPSARPGAPSPGASPAPGAAAGGGGSGALATAWALVGGGLAGGLVLISVGLVVAQKLGLWGAATGGGEGGGGGGEALLEAEASAGEPEFDEASL